MDEISDFTALEREIGVEFAKKELLGEALTHRSYLNEHREYKGNHNERLEFLGDAVLELASTRFLFDTFPAKPEGELTAYRAALVNTNSLAESAQALNVGEHLRLSKGEQKDTGRARGIILADAFEAIIGAIYLDQGYDAAAAFIARTILAKLDSLLAKGAHQDAKSRYQEVAQERRGVTPSYKVLAEEGPDHAKRFTVGVFLGEREAARGDGPSKQEAEQAAAQAALAASGW
ncbi:MAG: ribonuclease III [Patescibacteria group bacterium]|nr:ribonuclease III [Patescibacteria group bacterium]MDE1944044.1 ribonuclease III [Patescibacteria group bacterium]MDE1944900.1 ribonuclease III [Patescibacteria group bacterium]MDE2057331.1 ribonuclease III [Patescibacteria group bacterium]